MLIIGHRGSSGSAPENTLAAFRLAWHERADMVELDVRLTADGELVVHHDSRLGRTTMGRGQIRKKTSRELQRLDAGSWFSPKFKSETVPTLAQVMHLLPASVGLNIEVKTERDRPKRQRLEHACAAAVRHDGPGRTIVVSSFNHRFLKRLHTLDASIPLGALYMPVRDVAKRPSRLARQLGITTFVCSRSQLRKRFVRDAHNHGLRVFVYGVNTARHLLKPRRFGVDGVITNYPARMRKLLHA